MCTVSQRRGAYVLRPAIIGCLASSGREQRITQEAGRACLRSADLVLLGNDIRANPWAYVSSK